MQDQLSQLQPRQAFHQKLIHSLLVEKQTLFIEMEYLQEKALLRDGKAVSYLESGYVCMFPHTQHTKVNETFVAYVIVK